MATNKLLWSSKLIGVFFIMLVCTLSANAQFLRTSYFMEGTHYRQQLNPALTPTKGYFNLPVIGAVNATVGSTSLGYQDIIDIIDDGDDFYTKPDFMNRLKDNNKLNVNFSTEILSAGWYKGKNFWSFNIGLRTDIGANLTKNMFTFLNEMETVEENWRNSNYDISGQQLNINAYTEIGLGLSRQINSRLTIGARVKALLGIGNMELKLNRVAMSANLPSDQQINQWSSESYWNSMSPSQAAQAAQELKDKFNNYHANLTVGAELKSSFKGLELQEEEGKDYVTDFDFDSGKLGIAGYGFGIDLGASYKILDNLTVSASVLDLGFISWSKSSTKIASANPDPIDIKGSTYANMVDPNNPNTVMNAVNQLQNDAQGYMDRVTNGDVLDYDMLQLEVSDAKESRKSRLASTLVLGAEYGFFNNKLAVGVLSTTRFVQPDALTELTFSANYRPKSWFNVALSYSAIQSAGKSFGLGLKLGPLFVGTDYMFLGKNSNSVNGFVGVSIPLGGRKASKEG
ncbi:hypothetical protein F3D69_27625 [Bacteroides ovatus]|uniref:DUF5723 domain-containing protein n=1 Tax=Bacteroides ovatus TaxID=28116 RepID=A0A5M5DPB1_BACOV|nr:hypothetical protein F3F37_26925 [Bacteroides ovatus]KAA4003046.1 hypothetical protein F3D64_26525 [Bacteroides ovatus]KAA4015157.1 hypothetical protein F3D53_26490 [Bacteroides ovatus]KAA4025366.1 hypothetical protein F3D52_23920 [Bacteroides ovatus]KAA4027618.1 hypothetical protein F3D60_17820 [Bacteroides ovatus]